MRITLMPHSKPYFGQDFTSFALIKRRIVSPLYLKNGEYPSHKKELGKSDLVITRYPDLTADNIFIQDLPENVPVVSHVHLRYNFLNSLQRQNIASSLRRSRIAITNCKSLRAEYKYRFPEVNWVVVNNGIDKNIFKPTTGVERAEFKNQYQIPHAKRLISYVGRLNTSKGFSILDKICAFVSDSNEYYLVIQSIFIKKHHSKTLYLLSKYKNLKVIYDQSIKVVRYSDLNISTSLSETTSLVTLESLFSGVPVVCTKSTKFYREIKNYKIAYPYFRNVKLPERFIESTPVSKTRLKLSEAEAVTIANAFIGNIKRTKGISQRQRKLLSTLLSNSKFEISEMLENLRRIYKMLETIS